MSVSLIKEMLHRAFVRTMDDGAFYDLLDWQHLTAPLWYDDASYLRYLSEGDIDFTPYVEFGFLPGEPVLVRRTYYYGDATSDSRAVRRLMSRFDEQRRAIVAAGAADRVTAGWGVPF
jgi:hypothetical protein